MRLLVFCQITIGKGCNLCYDRKKEVSAVKYTPYCRIQPGAKKAALFVHGIVGTPMHFRDLVPLIPQDWSVYNILLDGHGKQVEDFAHTSMVKWQAQVAAQLDAILSQHEQVLIVAHSMGTLFAIDEAIKRPDKVMGLFLLNVPLTPMLPPKTALNSLKTALGLTKPGTPARDMLDGCGVHLSPMLWKYLAWIPRFWELIVKARSTRRKLSEISVPCLAFQSQKDELVSKKSYALLNAHPGIDVTMLPNSGHFAYKGNDLSVLQVQLQNMITK